MNESESGSKKMQNQSNNYLYIKILLMSVSLTIALVMLDANLLIISAITFLLFSPLMFLSVAWGTIVYTVYDIVRPILYIWALVVTIKGEQDFIAMAFYILAILQAINIAKRFIGTLIVMFGNLTKRG